MRGITVQSTKTYYKTVRCQDCECWLHPRAVEAHAGRCVGHAWIDALNDSALVTAELAQVLGEVLAPELVDRPMFCGERLLSPGPREFLTPDVCHGLVVTSPVAGVGSRRWTLVADAAWRSGGKAGLRRALSAEGFAQLEAELGLDLVACPHCAAVVKARGLGTHQASNAACRWRRAMVEVRRLWAKGSRDPWSVADAPLEWGALKAESTWRRRLQVVEFPRWGSVLLAPAPGPPLESARPSTHSLHAN